MKTRCVLVVIGAMVTLFVFCSCGRSRAPVPVRPAPPSPRVPEERAPAPPVDKPVVEKEEATKEPVAGEKPVIEDPIAAEKEIHDAIIYRLKNMNAQCDMVVVGTDEITDTGVIGTIDLDVYCSSTQKATIAKEAASQFFRVLPKFNEVRVSVYNYRTGGPEHGVDQGEWMFDNPR